MNLRSSGLSRTFDPFLPCHSHHIHSILSRAGGVRHIANLRSSSTQPSSGQSEQQPQASQGASQTSADSAQQQGATSQQAGSDAPSQAQTDAQGDSGGRRTAEFEGTFPVHDPRHVMNVLNSIFPVFSNVTIRRNNSTSNNSTSTESKPDFNYLWVKK